MPSMQRLFSGASPLSPARLLDAIANGKEGVIRAQLKSRLKADAFSEVQQQSLLDYAISQGQIGIAALFLLYGADPNKSIMVKTPEGGLEQKPSADAILNEEYFNAPLAKLLILHGADYAGKRTPQKWPSADVQLEARGHQQEGNQQFTAKNYQAALAAYQKALPLLQGFKEDESGKLAFQMADNMKTHPIIIECYQQHITACEKQIAECEKHLGKVASHAERAGAKAGEATPTRRKPTSSSARSLSFTFSTRHHPRTSAGKRHTSTGSGLH